MSKKERKGFVKEFKEFISRGSIVDMAVGVVVGGAFTTIVNTLVKSVLTPLINWVVYLLCGGNIDAFKGLDVVLITATSTTNPVFSSITLRSTLTGNEGLSGNKNVVVTGSSSGLAKVLNCSLRACFIILSVIDLF